MRRFANTRLLRRAFSSTASHLGKQKSPLSKWLTTAALSTTGGLLGFAMLNSRGDQGAQQAEELVTREIGTSNDFLDGQLRVVQLGPDTEMDTIIVVRLEGKLYACSSRCSHMGAPMTRGYLFDDKIYCPYHLASYSVKTGYPDTGPMMDGIPVYPIEEKNGKVTVTVPRNLENSRSTLPTVSRDPANKEKFVIVGGGVAGGSCAETLRQSGFTGEIVMINADDSVPYDRSFLTKSPVSVQLDKIKIRSESYLENIGITVRNNSLVTEVNPDKKEVTLKSGEKISYDKLLVATGGSPKKLKIPGSELPQVCTIRDFQDIEKIKNSLKTSKNVVCIGGGFISTEAASNIKNEMKDVNVTVVCRRPPFVQYLGPEIAQVMTNLVKTG